MFFSLSRLLNYTIYENATTVVFVCNMFTWAYGRLYCFAFYVTWQIMAWQYTDLLENGGWFAMYSMQGMMIVLNILNYLWYWMMLKKMFEKLSSGGGSVDERMPADQNSRKNK